MKRKVIGVGNSLVVALPQPIRELLEIERGDDVEIRVNKCGEVIISKFGK